MLSFSKWLLEEMPMQLKLLGKWDKNTPSNYGWDKPSVSILTSPVGVQKIEQKWSKLPQQFNAWMLRGPGASKFQQVGKVPPEYLTKNFNLKIVPNPQAPDEISINPSAINVIYTQNIGSEKVPMNYWTIGHRLGHAIQRNQEFIYFKNEVEKDLLHLLQIGFGRGPEKEGMYGGRYSAAGNRLLKQIATALGTMGSARKNALRIFPEFYFELLAQYMITGKITLNRMPFKILSHYAWGKPQHIYPHYSLKPEDHEGINEYIEYMENKYNNILERTLDSAIGKIYVM